MHRNRQRGGTLTTVLLGILVAAVLALTGLVAFGVFVARNITVRETRAGDVSVETPIGSMRVREHGGVDPRLLGVPVYPGAERRDDGRKMASFEFDFGEHNEFSLVAAEYTTTDSPEKVVEFYRYKLPHWIIREKRRGRWQLTGTEEGYKRIIAIRERHGVTHIGLASVGEPASN